MKLAVSNLAWDFSENEKIFEYLQRCGIEYVEGVLSKLGSWDSISFQDLEDYKTKLSSYNLNVDSIQSIFYNQKSLGLHHYDGNHNHFQKLIDFSKILGVKVMVLGSPNLRVPSDNLKEDLSQTFKKIDGLLDSTGIELLIEPNTKGYGGHYFYNLREIVDFITENNLRNIKTMIDTHNLFLEGYNPITEFVKFRKFISHIHISEDKLLPLYDMDFHKSFALVLRESNYDRLITYELKPTEHFTDTVLEFKEIYS